MLLGQRPQIAEQDQISVVIVLLLGRTIETTSTEWRENHGS